MTVTINGTTGITTPSLTNEGGLAGTTGTFSGLISANGGQIKFPATQSASTDANTLDDYEEGTFQAYIAGSASGTQAFAGAEKGLQYNSANGRYTKIGKQVTVNLYIFGATSLTYNSGYSGTTLMWVAGLPFPEAGGTDISSIGGVFPAAAVGYLLGTGWTSGYAPMAFVESGGTTIRFGYMASNAFQQAALSLLYTASNGVVLTVSYQTTA